MKKCSSIFLPAVFAVMLVLCGPAWAEAEINAAKFPDNVSANYVYVAISANNFPDEVFRNYVSSNFDTDNDGRLSENEIASVTSIDVSSSGIASLTGIKYFTALTYLDCQSNQLTTLDVSRNILLTDLYCQNNQLTGVDLSNNTALKNLSCDFTIDIANNRVEFNIIDFINAYQPLGDSMLLINFNFCFENNVYSQQLDPDIINHNNVVSQPIQAGETLSYLRIVFTYRDYQNRNVYVYPSSGASSGIAPIITTRSLPIASLDVSYSAIISAIGTSPITWTPASSDLPPGLSLDSAGTISGTPTAPGAFSFTAHASNSFGSASKLFIILVPFPAVRSPKITAGLLNTGYTDSPYGFQLTATGTSPLTWSLAEGSSLPEGLTLTDSGYLYGTPVSADTTAFTVCAANSAGTDSRDFTLTVYESPSRTRPAVLPENPHPAALGSSYVCQLAALGTPPFSWTLKGKLPSGLSMTDSGLITGTPTKAAAQKITFTVSNDYGRESRTLTLNICKLPEITTKALKNASVGKKYSETVKASATKPLTWELEGTLPRGIPLFEADKARISGTPSVNDAGMIRVTLSNPVGETSKVFPLYVSAVLPKISPNTLKEGTYGKIYSAAVKTSKGTPPVTLVLSGDLPRGLAFDSSTGKITGTPSETCTCRKITVFACSMAGVVSADYSLTINSAAGKLTASNSAGTLPKNYAFSEVSAPELTGKHTESVGDGNTDFTTPAEQNTAAQKSAYTVQIQDALPENAGSVFDGGGYTVIAELPEISVDVSGMYDLDAVLDEAAEQGAKIFWLANSSEHSDDDSIAEFFDEAGREIDAVPEKRRVSISVWLNAGRIYRPVIAVKQ
ncbi:MAG: putative Ig domain-containing protein [Synergistaceae bacterium]|nr:putative Ig domain-containing protein [Synergistaceae bacterium]